jgi:hypothetical protein
MLPQSKEQSMSKLFSVAGVSTLNGIVKFRVANGTPVARAKVLERSGHTNIDLFALNKPMTKEEAFAHLVRSGYTESKSKTNRIKSAEAAAKIKQPKATQPKGVKLAKFLPTTKEVPAAELIEQVGLVVAKNGAPTTKSMEEIARIKAKNLQTMRQVTNKLRAVREF